jgi:hypothetical protein
MNRPRAYCSSHSYIALFSYNRTWAWRWKFLQKKEKISQGFFGLLTDVEIEAQGEVVFTDGEAGGRAFILLP